MNFIIYFLLLSIALLSPVHAVASYNTPETHKAIGAKLDLLALDDLSAEAENIWRSQVQKFGSPSRAVAAMHCKNPPQEVLNLAQQLGNFLLTTQANSKELIIWTTPVKIHPLLVHLLIATIVSHSEKIIDDTRPFWDKAWAHRNRLIELLMSVESPDWESYEIKKSSPMTRRAARAVLVALTIILLWDKKDIPTAISPLTLNMMERYTTKDLHFLAENMVGFDKFYYAITATFQRAGGMTGNENIEDTYEAFKVSMTRLSPVAD